MSTGLGQRGATELGWDLPARARRAHAFGPRVHEIDGHNLSAIDDAFATCKAYGDALVVLGARDPGVNALDAGFSRPPFIVLVPFSRELPVRPPGLPDAGRLADGGTAHPQA